MYPALSRKMSNNYLLKGEFKMMSKYVQINHRKVISLLLAVILLSLTTGPALANLASDKTGQNDNLVPCANYENFGVLGREGGLLGLLEVGRDRDPILVTIVTGEAYSLRAVQNGSASYVIYIRTECLEKADCCSQ
jgi:hypothetical protein